REATSPAASATATRFHRIRSIMAPAGVCASIEPSWAIARAIPTRPVSQRWFSRRKAPRYGPSPSRTSARAKFRASRARRLVVEGLLSGPPRPGVVLFVMMNTLVLIVHQREPGDADESRQHSQRDTHLGVLQEAHVCPRAASALDDDQVGDRAKHRE